MSSKGQREKAPWGKSRAIGIGQLRCSPAPPPCPSSPQLVESFLPSQALAVYFAGDHFIKGPETAAAWIVLMRSAVRNRRIKWAWVDREELEAAQRREVEGRREEEQGQ